MRHVMIISPPAREPRTDALRRFLRRGDYPTLLAYWLHYHMSRHRWRALVEIMIEELTALGGRSGVFYVDGLGLVGGVVMTDAGGEESRP